LFGLHPTVYLLKLDFSNFLFFFNFVSFYSLGGIVVVPPSTNKTWLRPLWNTSLIDIPDELLTHVAIATGSLQLPVDDLDENELDEHNSISSSGFSNKNDETKDEASLIHTVILEFQNEDSMEVSGIQLQHLKDADYFSALLSGRWVVEETDTIPKFKIESDMETFVRRRFFSQSKSKRTDFNFFSLHTLVSFQHRKRFLLF